MRLIGAASVALGALAVGGALATSSAPPPRSAPAPAASEQGLPAVVPTSREQVRFSFSPVVKRVRGAVVNVYASRVERIPSNPLFDDPVFRHFFGDDGGGEPTQQRTQRSLGSGVIVDPTGLVVTNNHVIEGMTDIKVALTDRRELSAKILLRDKRTDLAVLRLQGGSVFPTVELGDSDALEVGDFVLAIGDPFGVGQTVTQGIVSALARTNVGASDYQFFIQTDAAINPGNSGGALVDTDARLVGINSSILSRSGGNMGIGFAIPVNMVKTVVATAKAGGKEVRRPWLGAALQAVSPEIAESLGLARPTGALVTSVDRRGPAAAAGLRQGDLITAVDGRPVDDPDGFGFRLGVKPVGGTVTLSVLRHGTAQTVAMKLVSAPEVPPRNPVKLGGNSPFTGATAINLSPAVDEEFSLDSDRKGVILAEIEAGSIAAQLGLLKGDIVVAVNDETIGSTGDLARAAASQPSQWKLTIQRGSQVFTTVVGG